MMINNGAFNIFFFWKIDYNKLTALTFRGEMPKNFWKTTIITDKASLNKLLDREIYSRHYRRDQKKVSPEITQAHTTLRRNVRIFRTSRDPMNSYKYTCTLVSHN